MPAPDNTPAGPSPTDTPPKRRFWQVHLSTFVLLTVVSGLSLGMNLHWSGLDKTSNISAQGWPCAYHFRTERNAEYVYWLGSSIYKLPVVGHTPPVVDMVVDIAVALLLVTGVAVSSEYLIRRRRKP
jgi:hypothetical protein